MIDWLIDWLIESNLIQYYDWLIDWLISEYSRMKQI